MSEEVGGILIDSVRTGARQLVVAIATREQPHAQRARPSCGQQVPHAVPDDDGSLDWYAELLGGREEQVGIGLGMAHLVPGDDRDTGGDLSMSSVGCALSRQPLVAIAQGTPARVRCSSSSRAPGSGRTCPTSRAYSSA